MNEVEWARQKIEVHEAAIRGLRKRIIHLQASCMHEYGPWKHYPATSTEDPAGGDVIRTCLKCGLGDLVKCPKCNWGASYRGAGQLRCYSCKFEFTVEVQ